jgi:hypothetical protein
LQPETVFGGVEWPGDEDFHAFTCGQRKAPCPW